MKFLQRMKIWAKAKGEKAFKVTELQKALDTKEELKKQSVKITSAYNTSRAEREATLKQKAAFEEKIKACDKKFAQFAQEGDKAKAQIVHEKKKSIETTVKSLEATLKVQETAIERLGKQKAICDKNLVKIENSINAIKVKERYAEQVEKYQEILDNANINGTSMEDIEFNVDVKFHEADLRMQDLEKAQDVESILDDVEDDDFEAAFAAACKKEDVNSDEEC